MIHATISARATGQPVISNGKNGTSVCCRHGILSVYVKDGWYDETFTFIAYGKAADTLAAFTKPKIMATGEWVVRKPDDNEGPDKVLEFHISKIHNA